MKIKLTLIFALSVFSIYVSAQSSIDIVLAEIARNNKSVLAYKQYQEALGLGFRTGLTPDNPKMEYDYLPGSPAGAGVQRDFSITQGFDFPTAYGKRSKVADQRIVKSNFEVDAFRQNILLEAKKYCLELIYRNKLRIELARRFEHAGGVHQNYKIKLDNGQANVLDVNKASLQLLTIKTELQVNESERNKVLHKLSELNGGVEVILMDTIYPPLNEIPAFEEMDSLIEANDPVVKIIKQEREVAKHQLGLTKSLTLPKIETGYHSQSILGQQYQGAHFGLSIPLWENRNKVRAQNANLAWSDLQIQEHRTEHFYRNKQLYEQYLNFKGIVEEYQHLLGNMNHMGLLLKALYKGEISSIEYFMEQRYFYSAYDKLLLSDLELQKTVAELYKFEL
jgi:outer membrane protein TolC